MTATPPASDAWLCPTCGHSDLHHPVCSYDDGDGCALCRCVNDRESILFHHLTATSAALTAARAENERFFKALETVIHLCAGYDEVNGPTLYRVAYNAIAAKALRAVVPSEEPERHG